MLTAACSSTMKRTSMELGGNAPFIVFADANLEAALDGLMASKFRNSGQTCVCANRILVEDGIYEQFASALKAATQKLIIGNGLDSNTSMGPLIHRAASNACRERVDVSLREGAQLFWPDEIPADTSDNFAHPVILTNVTSKMAISREEIFGPIVPLTRFEGEDEAIRLANDTEAGLAAYLYTKDPSKMMRVTESLQYGIVGINEGIISNEMAPFGGMKESGNGREGSKYGLDDYLEIKYVCIGGLG